MADLRADLSDPLLPGHEAGGNRHSINRVDSKEMTELASDTQSEETGKMMRRMDEYHVVGLMSVTDPTPGSRNLRKKDVAGRRFKSWTANRSRAVGRYDAEPTSPGSMQTSYFSHDDDTDSANYIQHIFAEEGFGTSRMTTRNQVSVDDNCATTAACDHEIDGMSSSFMSDEDFIPIDSVGARDMSTTQALQQCNKYVLKPYNSFLKVIGWRPFHSTRLEHIAWYKKLASTVYPCFVFLMLLLTSAAQALLCFIRSKATRFERSDYNGSNITCEANIVSSVIAGDGLIFAAYLWGLYIYRFSDPEHLSALIETVFLSYNTRLVRRSQGKLVIFLLFFLVMGLVWMIFSLGLSVARLFVFETFNSTSHFYFLRYNSNNTDFIDDKDIFHDHKRIQMITVHIIAVFALIGFLFFDLLYMAVVINYCSQCKLLHYYVVNVTEKIRHKAYGLGDAVKEMYRVHEFLQVLNGKVSIITSLVFFLFVQGTILSYIDYMMVEPDDTLSIVVGAGNIIQWSSATLIPLILAARLTGACKDLKKVCLEVGARPFVYSETPQLVLDSFLLYTLSTNYRAKLGCVPIHPEYIFLIGFILAMIFTIDPYFSRFQFAEWL